MNGKDQSLGFRVRAVMSVRLVEAGCAPTQIYRNVTEIHWNYNHQDPASRDVIHGARVVFNSDIHGTGYTWPVLDVLEFEATPETEIAESM